MPSSTTVCLLCDERIHAVVFGSNKRRYQILARGMAEFGTPDSLFLEHDTDPLADAVATAVANTGIGPQTIVLVVPLQWCFTHVLTQPSRRSTTRSLAFLLEEYLPVPLEELTCAFSPQRNGQVLAAAVATEPMRRLLDALSRRGVNVESIAIDAVEAPANAADEHSSSVAIVDTRWVRAAVVQGYNAVHGLTAFGIGDEPGCTGITDALQRRRMIDKEQDGKWLILELAGQNPPRETVKFELERSAQGRSLLADDAVDAIATAVASRPLRLNLRTGALAGRRHVERTLQLVHQCAVLALALVLLWIGGMELHRRVLTQNLSAVNTARLATYREVFVGKRLPPGAALRLASERIRLEGLTSSREASTGGSSTAPRLDPLDGLRNVVEGLPSDVRVMLLGARLDEKQWTLRGQTMNHRDAERIVEAINSIPGVQCRPPRTTRLRMGGVEFSIIATTKGAR